MTSKKKNEPNWSEASAELEQILQAIESGEIDLDALHEKVGRAAELIQLCRDKLGSTELKVKKVVDALQQEPAAAAGEDDDAVDADSADAPADKGLWDA